MHLYALFLVVGVIREAAAVSGIYVNNQKIERYEPSQGNVVKPSVVTTHRDAYVSKDSLVRKQNFTENIQQYYQYLVGEHSHKYVDQRWRKNQSQHPSSVTPTVAPSLSYGTLPKPILNYADDLSSIKNTYNNTDLVYVTDYQPSATTQSTVTVTPQHPAVVNSTKASTGTNKKRKKKPTIGNEAHPGQHPPLVLSTHRTELTPETLALLSRYYSFSCTLTPIQPNPSAVKPTKSTSAVEPTTTHRTKHRHVTTTRSPTTTASPKTEMATTSTPAKQRKPVVYVDPPVIKRIGGVLETVYRFMENALTSTEYVEESNERRAANERSIPANETSHEQELPPMEGIKKVKRNTDTQPSGGTGTGTAMTGSTSQEGMARVTILDNMQQTWLPITGDGPSKITKHITPKRVTISGLPATVSNDGNANKMTTNIQVTSEYTAATPPTLNVGNKPSAEDDYEDDSSESDESDEDYLEGFVGFDGGEDDDDDGTDEDEDDNSGQYAVDSSESTRPNRVSFANDKDYDEEGSHAARPVKVKRVKKRRRKKRPVDSYEDTAEYSEEDTTDEGDGEYDDRDESTADDDEDEDDESGESDSEANAGGFFSQLFSTFGRFVRSLGFGPVARRSPVDYDELGGARSTTPRVLNVRKRPTRSTSGWGGPGDEVGSELTTSGLQTPSNWLGLPASFYLMNGIDDVEDDVNVVVPPTVTPEVSSSSSNWFELMMPWDFLDPWSSDDDSPDAAEVVPATPQSMTEPPEVLQDVKPPSTPPMTGWLSQLFGARTTTAAPPSTSSAPAPEQLLSALVQYVGEHSPNKRPLGVGSTRPTKPPSDSVSYAGYHLQRLFLQTDAQFRHLEDYRRTADGVRLRWWAGPTLLGPTDVLVPPGIEATSFREFLDEEEIRHEPMIRDVGRAIAYENPRMTRREQLEMELLHGHPLTWYRYHRYADIVKFTYQLQRRHADRVQLLHIGRSYEGRPLTVVRVSFAPRQVNKNGTKYTRPRKRPAIFVEAGARGHHWIGPAVATWLLNRLLEIPTNGSEAVAEMGLQSYDWYVMPVLNPDGYEYSHKHDRMWSKSRSVVAPQPPSGVGEALLSSAIRWWNAHKPHAADEPERRARPCIGADLNRNWAFRWQETVGEPSVCDDHFAGSGPFSEPETRALRDFLLTGRRNVRLYLSLQAYGQVLSYPAPDSSTPDGEGTRSTERRHDDDVHELASHGLVAMRAEAGEFLYDLRADHGPVTFGTSTAYARHVAGIRSSYTLRLPDKGTHGFLLPPSNIIVIGRDTFALLRGMIDYS